MITSSVLAVAKSANGNPVTAVLTVMLFYCMFTFVEASIERLIFGERFEHWLDPVFGCAFICYAAYVVWMCATYQMERG